MERNLLLKIQYDGSAYHGWQVQENARSVQGVFQEALKQVLHTQPDIKACSRTDTGVHAREFCLSMKLSHNIPPERLLGALNHFLPPDIAVLSCEEVPLDFHARYSCCGKRYVYEIWNNPIRSPFLHGRALHYYHHIDEKKLNEAAQHFLGAHDFTSFCTLDNRDMGGLYPHGYGKLRYARGRHGALYRGGGRVPLQHGAHHDGHFARRAAGALCPRGHPEDRIEGKNRKLAGPTAPACGLYLEKVFYKPQI